MLQKGLRLAKRAQKHKETAVKPHKQLKQLYDQGQQHPHHLVLHNVKKQAHPYVLPPYLHRKLGVREAAVVRRLH